MKKAVQQIMLGTVTGSEAQTRETLARIRAAGYDGLELNRFMIHPASMMVRLMTRAAMTPILKADSMELGTGNMDLDGLKAIAVDNGIQAVVLESNKNWIEKDPVKSLELSARWLNAKY